MDFGEFYDYPGLDVTRDGLERYADLRLRALEQFAVVGKWHQRVPGVPEWYPLHPGGARGTGPPNEEYLITDVTHTGYNGSYTAGDAAEPELTTTSSARSSTPNDFRPPAPLPFR